jgi:hypoxanthine-guanine phosphoribosyltransferase
LHASRYGEAVNGSQLQWLIPPPKQKHIAGRAILLIDDILDEGINLEAVKGL